LKECDTKQNRLLEALSHKPYGAEGNNNTRHISIPEVSKHKGEARLHSPSSKWHILRGGRPVFT
jgi:hypothetical protein